jgi:hypothetical protein
VIRSLVNLLADIRAGRSLRRLHEAKRARGIDFTLSTSWCSDHQLIVVLVRAPGARLGQPVLDWTPGAALARAEERAKAPWRTSS